MASRRRLVALVLVISSVILLAVFDGLLQCLSLFCCPHFLEASHCFCQPSYKLLAIIVSCLFAVLLAVLEASRYFVGCLFAFVICHLGSFHRQSWKLFVVFVGRLGSFSLFSSAILEASVCRSCCFVVGRFLAALASCSCCFLAFFGSSFCCFSRLFFSFFFSKNFFWLSISNWSTH